MKHIEHEPRWQQTIRLRGLHLTLTSDNDYPPGEDVVDDAMLLLRVIVLLRRRRRELGLPDENVVAGDLQAGAMR